MKKVRTKTIGFVGMVSLLVLGLPLSSGALWGSVEVSFRLSGSLGYLQDGAGDIDKTRRGMETVINTLYQDERYSTSFSWEKPSKSNDFRAEIVFRLSKIIGISIGSGYISAKNNGNYSIDYSNAREYGNNIFEEDNQNIDYSRSYDVSSIPLTFDTYLYFPIGKRETFKIFAHAGVGYYFGRLKHTINLDGTFIKKTSVNGELQSEDEDSANSQFIEKTNSRSWGIHGGFGLDVKLTRLLSIGAEVYGRRVNFRDWEGGQVAKYQYNRSYWSTWGGQSTSEDTYTDSSYGKMWTFEVDLANGEDSYAVMAVRDEEPDSNYYKKARMSAINLNSYGFTVSVKLSFDLF
jgi:hypothetical protein